MSVSVTEMAERDRSQSSASSKKRKHTDEERAERKKNKKQKHVEIEGSPEVAPSTETADITKKKKKGKLAQEEDAPRAVTPPQELQPDIELRDMDITVESQATDDKSSLRKKKKKSKSQPEAEPSSPKPAETQEEEDIELPDAVTDTFNSSPPLSKNTTSTTASASATQPTPPSTSSEGSPFHTVHSSLYVPCPAISLTTALPSLISTHLTPLLLTYYAPLGGIVLSITDASISPTTSTSPGSPLTITSSPSNTLALCADDAGVSFTWLSFTALLFHPSPSTTHSGYINVTSEGFIGLVLYNYFQVGIPKSRIPRGWKWIAPGGVASTASATKKKQPKKGRIRDADSDEATPSASSPSPQVEQERTNPTTSSAAPAANDDNDALLLQSQTNHSSGHWSLPDGSILSENSPLTFRVIDSDVVPSSSRGSYDRLTLQIEGTLLSEDEEEEREEEERARFQRSQDRAWGRKVTASLVAGSRRTGAQEGSPDVTMSGGLQGSRESSVAALRHRVAY